MEKRVFGNGYIVSCANCIIDAVGGSAAGIWIDHYVYAHRSEQEANVPITYTQAALLAAQSVAAWEQACAED